MRNAAELKKYIYFIFKLANMFGYVLKLVSVLVRYNNMDDN